MSDIDDKYPDVTPGGHWTPVPRCGPRYNVAIVVPFRERESHLPIFLDNMHRFLQLQSLEYTIYIVEQAPGVVFNRALLMNVGYLEAKKIRNYDCYVFHDIDMIPVDIRNVYDCPNNPRHLAVARDKAHYHLPYNQYFGGGIVLKPEHLEKMNGFTNIMFGWGGEDDESYRRVKKAGLKLERYPSEIGRYRSISFDHKDGGNPKSRRSFNDVDKVSTLSRRDGLNSVKYTLLSLNKYPLYTRIVAQCDGPRTQNEIKTYMNQQMSVLRKQIVADKISGIKSKGI